MKFSSSLKFNAVSEWWDEYIAYDALKKYIYHLEKHPHDLSTLPLAHSNYTDLEAANEHSSLLDSSERSKTDALFIPLLDKELSKITNFYLAQEEELKREVQELEEAVERQEESWAGGADGRYLDDDDEDEEDDEDDEDGSRPPHQRRRRRMSSSVGQSGSRFNTVGASTILEEPPSPTSPGHTARRYSVASSDSDDHTHPDVNASWYSTQSQARRKNKDKDPDSHSPDAASKSPLGKARALAHRFTPFASMRDSFSSTGDPGAHASVWTSRSSLAWDTRLLFKRRITLLYVRVTGLKSYVEVNWSGIRKILKKYDKVTYNELKDAYLHSTAASAPPFADAHRAVLNDLVGRLEGVYAKCVTRGDRALALQQLRLNVRENIAWERDTVWRQMIGRERRGEGHNARALGARVSSPVPDALVSVRTLAGRFYLTGKKISLVVAVVVFIVLLNVRTMEEEAAGRCLAVLVFATIMWATEAIPLFVTSLLVPLLLVVLRVMRSEDEEHIRLSAPEATKYVFSTMFSPTIMLLIGGFTISSALSKTAIDRVLITRVLALAGTKPNRVLLAVMGVSCFASMWISNVAAPTLCFTLVRPILRTLPPKANFGPALIIAIALAANIGGQSSPISSPQNLIALQAMDPALDWGSWFAVALPVSLVSVVLIWLLLLAAYRPARAPGGEGDLEIRPIRPTKERFSLRQWWVTGVCLVTIALWCVAHSVEQWVGDMGVIAIIPLVAFFGTGVLKKDDFEQFAWTIVFLAMGGIALGKGVTSSGLLSTLDDGVRDLVDGRTLYTVVLVLSPVVLVISTFISHTIASVLLVPIAKEVGERLPGDHANLLIFITALICSTGMGMPVSGFPNQTAATQEDELGQLYLSNVDFLKNGVPASIIATLVVATIGFLLMKAISL